MKPSAINTLQNQAVDARRRRQPAGSALDSPMRTMFGLLVLWGAMMLICEAVHISENSILPTGMPSLESVKTLKTRDMMMQPFSVNLMKDAPREHLLNVAKQCGLQLQEDDLREKFSRDKRVFELKDIPLYRALHQLIDNRAIGFAVQGKTIMLFDQKLDPADPLKKAVNWQAELNLPDEPLLVFPSGDSDIWFSIQMIRDVNRTDNPWRHMQVELWNGAELQNMATPDLDDNGKALISMSTRHNITFQIERLPQAAAKPAPGRFRITFGYQSF